MNAKTTARLFAVIAVVTVALFTIGTFVMSAIAPKAESLYGVPAKYHTPQYTIHFGDCMADGTSTDIYLVPDSYCESSYGTSNAVAKLEVLNMGGSKLHTSNNGGTNSGTNDSPVVPVVNYGDDGIQLPDNGGNNGGNNGTPSNDKKDKHCNNGEGNGSEGCSPANSTHANNDEDGTSKKDVKKSSLAGMVVYVLLRRGRKVRLFNIGSFEYKTLTYADGKSVKVAFFYTLGTDPKNDDYEDVHIVRKSIKATWVYEQAERVTDVYAFEEQKKLFETIK